MEIARAIAKLGFRRWYERQLYDADEQALLNRLRRLSDGVTSVMVVGHNPAIQAFSIDLAKGGDLEAMARLESKFPTGGFATLVLKGKSWKELETGDCELHSFVVPRELR